MKYLRICKQTRISPNGQSLRLKSPCIITRAVCNIQRVKIIQILSTQSRTRHAIPRALVPVCADRLHNSAAAIISHRLSKQATIIIGPLSLSPYTLEEAAALLAYIDEIVRRNSVVSWCLCRGIEFNSISLVNVFMRGCWCYGSGSQENSAPLAPHDAPTANALWRCMRLMYLPCLILI